ncbi:MAG TPA: hypothetical protein DDY43_12540, partial [Synechococcales bacterium UBA10510]|nr:hypothetical protein [Synechococcales bacterium UBA10510]
MVLRARADRGGTAFAAIASVQIELAAREPVATASVLTGPLARGPVAADSRASGSVARELAVIALVPTAPVP